MGELPSIIRLCHLRYSLCYPSAKRTEADLLEWRMWHSTRPAFAYWGRIHACRFLAEMSAKLVQGYPLEVRHKISQLGSEQRNAATGRERWPKRIVEAPSGVMFSGNVREATTLKSPSYCPRMCGLQRARESSSILCWANMQKYTLFQSSNVFTIKTPANKSECPPKYLVANSTRRPVIFYAKHDNFR